MPGAAVDAVVRREARAAAKATRAGFVPRQRPRTSAPSPGSSRRRASCPTPPSSSSSGPVSSSRRSRVTDAATIAQAVAAGAPMSEAALRSRGRAASSTSATRGSTDARSPGSAPSTTATAASSRPGLAERLATCRSPPARTRSRRRSRQRASSRTRSRRSSPSAAKSPPRRSCLERRRRPSRHAASGLTPVASRRGTPSGPSDSRRCTAIGHGAQPVSGS